MAQATSERTVLKAPLVVEHPITGVPLLALTLEAGGPRFTLFDFAGRPRIRLDANASDGAVVELLDDAGLPVVELYDLGQDLGGMVTAIQPFPEGAGQPAGNTVATASLGDDAGPG